jgi:uncharacterized protein YcbX
MFQITALHVYPIKSCRGVAVQSLDLDRLGPANDRRFMLVNGAGRFVTQREHHALALVTVRLSADMLEVEAPGAPPLSLKLGAAASTRPVVVWRFETEALDCGDAAAAWFSGYLGVPVRVVEFDRSRFRAANPDRAPEGSSAGLFSDGYPVLLATEASLADLNARLTTPLPMDRFRPNVVVSGTAPFEEDLWTNLRIGEVTFRVAKSCERCVITTVDQETGIAGKEPLATLSKFRKHDGAVHFATNLVHLNTGTLRVGDPVTLTE